MENTLGSKPSQRPEQIDHILSSLERYNTESISVLESYVSQQASEGFHDIAANLALLKHYQFNSRAAKDDFIMTTLSMALVKFYTSDFTCALHLLPPYILTMDNPPTDSLAQQTQKLFQLYTLLDSARYTEFWSTFESDDSYADIVADVQGFEDELRLSIAKTVEISSKQIAVPVFQDWSNLSETKFTNWIENTLHWTIVNQSVIVPFNKDNDAKMVVTTENVKFEQLSRIVKRAYELNV
jgi:translation initiation factor 3 subunit K